jgi:hypothetical protein
VRASVNSVPGPLLRVAGGVEWVTMLRRAPGGA